MCTNKDHLEVAEYCRAKRVEVIRVGEHDSRDSARAVLSWLSTVSSVGQCLPVSELGICINCVRTMSHFPTYRQKRSSVSSFISTSYVCCHGSSTQPRLGASAPQQPKILGLLDCGYNILYIEDEFLKIPRNLYRQVMYASYVAPQQTEIPFSTLMLESGWTRSTPPVGPASDLSSDRSVAPPGTGGSRA